MVLIGNIVVPLSLKPTIKTIQNKNFQFFFLPISLTTTSYRF
ncbi:unnamed protein product [Arabidopsis halleri]